jgi:hypothetical protein
MTDAAPRASRLRLYLPIAVAVILLGGYTLLWLLGARTMRAEIAEWVAEERASGREVAYEAVRIRGFPGTLRAMIDEPYWSEPGEWAWGAETLLIVTLPYDPSRLILTPRGDQSLTYGGEAYVVTADDLRVSLSEGSLVAETRNLVADGAAGEVRLGGALLNWSVDEGGRQVAGLAAEDVTLTEGGNETRLPFLRIAATESMGELELGGFEAALAPEGDADPALIAGEGRVTLTPGTFPEGRFDLRLGNAQGLVDAAMRRGVLDGDRARGARSLLGSLADGEGEVELPLVLSGGKLRIGFIPVADLPRLPE